MQFQEGSSQQNKQTNKKQKQTNKKPYTKK